MAKTTDNLMKMFTSGSEAVIRYLAFAEAADEEGMANAAKIFRTLAKAKRVHALSHYSAANATGTTAENLNLALEEESYDYKNAYPPMVQDAIKDEALAARHSFEYGMSIGPIITRLIGKAISTPDADDSGTYYVCPVCGNIEYGQPPAKCPFCGVDANDFDPVS